MDKNKSIVLCEKPSQARNIRAAIGDGHGRVLAARGHLLTLKEPQEVNPKWVKWSTDILLPDKPYGKKQAWGAGDALKQIRDALKTAETLVIATDCDREGLVIGRELADWLHFKGTVLRAIFGAEDKKSLITAFNRLVPISEFDGLYAAGQAREQADQIFNLSLTRTVSVHLGGHGKAIGIGRVRSPTLGIICQREQEIETFVPEPYHIVTAICQQNDREFTATYLNRNKGTNAIGSVHDAPNDGAGENAPDKDRGMRITSLETAEAIAKGARGWSGPVTVQVRPVVKAPPRPFDLSALQGHMGSRWKWPAKLTLEVAQTLYADLKLITYPRAECRYLPESQVPDAGPIRRALLQLTDLKLPAGLAAEPVVRQGKGRSNHYSDAGMGDSSHHAIQPNVSMMADLPNLWPQCNANQRKLAETVFLAFLEQTSEDALLEETRIGFTVPRDQVGQPVDAGFEARGRTIRKAGWMTLRGPKRDDQILPPIADGSVIRVTDSNVETKMTTPPKRFTEGGIIMAMRDAWKYLPATDERMKQLRQRLKDSSGIGTPATRDSIIESLVTQGQIGRKEGSFRPTPAGMALWRNLAKVAPELVDPGITALWEFRLDTLARDPAANRKWWEEVKAIATTAERARTNITTLPEGSLKDIFATTLKAGKGRFRTRGGDRKRGKGQAGSKRS